MKSTILILIFSCLLIQTEKNVDDLSKSDIPNKTEVRELNWNANEYKVYSDESITKYQIHKNRFPKVELPFEIKPPNEAARWLDSKTNRVIHKLNKGWLIGFDRGEWNGALFWFNNNGEKSYKITKGNIKNIHLLDNEIYITEGLAHLSSNKGQILKLIFQNGKWSSEKYFDLKKVPYASSISQQNKLIIATSDELLEFSIQEKKIKTIYDGFWNSLYPNSIIIKDSVCHIGMRGGIFKIQLKKPDSAKWLTE